MNKHTSIPDKDYFAIDAASVSLLKRLDCPAKALLPFRPSSAMLLGTLVHCAVLEPEEFDIRYVVAPVVNKRTKAGREVLEAFAISNSDKIVISIEDYDTAKYIARCVMAHTVAADLLSGGLAERAFQWKDERTGVDCKGKADYVKDNMIIDLKTAKDASPVGFSKACANFGYHMQDAHYTNGSGCEKFIFVVVETTYPFVVEVYELDDSSKDRGRGKVEDALSRYAELNMFDLWGVNYSGEDKITRLSLPNWA